MNLFLKILLFFVLAMPNLTIAHSYPSIKINGAYSIQDPAAANSAVHHKAQDIFLINHEINFELDISKFITPQSIFEKTNIIWNFGDGTGEQIITYGTLNKHRYQKPGQYIVSISADYKPAGFNLEIQELDSVLITIETPTVKKEIPLSSLEKPAEESQVPVSPVSDKNNTLLWSSFALIVIMVAYVLTRNTSKY